MNLYDLWAEHGKTIQLYLSDRYCGGDMESAERLLEDTLKFIDNLKARIPTANTLEWFAVAADTVAQRDRRFYAKMARLERHREAAPVILPFRQAA